MTGPARVALVTGAAQGIGRAIAETLADRGVAVGVADINLDGAADVADGIRGAGGRVAAIPFDVTDRASVLAGVVALNQEFGRVNILVNNVGWDELIGFLDSDEAFWECVIALKGRDHPRRPGSQASAARRVGLTHDRDGSRLSAHLDAGVRAPRPENVGNPHISPRGARTYPLEVRGLRIRDAYRASDGSEPGACQS